MDLESSQTAGRQSIPVPAPYTISTVRERLDVDAIHAFLVRSDWSPGIPRALVERAIAASLCFGLFHREADREAQVGFARMVTDAATFGYLCDVYVLEAHRGRGLGKALVAAVMNHPDLQGLRRTMLVTASAHGVYARFGFAAPAHPERVMEIMRPDIYRSRPEAH